MDAMPVICNPITGQYASFPELRRYRYLRSFLGFDPIDKQVKVLLTDCHRNFISSGTGEMRQRMFEWANTREFAHEPSCKGICINGVLYYLITSNRWSVIVCLDVRSETFKFIDRKSYGFWGTKLINYKGKLAGVELAYDEADAIELCLWVLEDVEKQEWSKCVYTLPQNELIELHKCSIVGVTATGEIVLSTMDYTSKSKPFYVFYFNPKRNTLQGVEIQGLGENVSKVYAFVDHVEDLNFRV